MSQYIDKSALVAEINRLDAIYHTSKSLGGELFIEGLLCFINSLEVKEVDLKEEIDKIWKPRFNLGWDDKSLLSVNYEGFEIIAKHFFELGLKTQKGGEEQSKVDYNKFEKLFDDFCERQKGYHVTSHDACMWFWELGLRTQKGE